MNSAWHLVDLHFVLLSCCCLSPCLHGGRVTLLEGSPYEEGYPPLLFFQVSFTCEVGLPQEEGNPTCLPGLPF